MKKLIGLLLTGVLVFSLAACGKNGTGDDQNSGENGQSTVEESTDNAQTDTLEETNYGVGVTMEDIKNALVETFGDNYWPNSEIPADMLQELCGIAPEMYEEYYAEMPMISTNVDTVIIVKAKEDQITAVEDALNAYRDMLVNDSMQYPMNVGKIQASRIETFGQYVCFVQLGADTMEAAESGDEAVIDKCQQDNELALEVIENTLAKNQ